MSIRSSSLDVDFHDKFASEQLKSFSRFFTTLSVRISLYSKAAMPDSFYIVGHTQPTLILSENLNI